MRVLTAMLLMAAATPIKAQMAEPFEIVGPDEALKKRALQRSYEFNGNSMVGGSIDVSNDPIVTGRIVITPDTEFNVLDATPVPAKKRKSK